MNQAPEFDVYACPPAPPTKPKYVFTRGEFWLALALWVVGYAYVASVPVGRHPLPALAVQVILLVGTFVYLTRPGGGGRATPWSATLVGVNVALCLSFLWSVNRALLCAVTLWNTFTWFYLVLLLTGNSRERWPGKSFLREAFAALSYPFRAPATAFAALFGSRRTSDGKKPKSRLGGAVGWAFLGLAMAGIPTLIVVLLLSYDEGFSGIIEGMADAVFERISVGRIFREVNNIGFGLLACALLFGAILGGRRMAARGRTDAVSDANTPPGHGTHVAPVVLVAAMLTPLMAVYVIFFVSQWDYYVSAFTGVRPEELTFATYAREGFFQLLVVALINAGLSVGAAAFARRRPYDPTRPKKERTHPVTRIYLALLALMTLVLIATAISKMFLYVETYGMSHKRVYATWLMLLLAVAFAAVLLRQVWTRLNLTGTLVAAFLAFFLAIALVPVDALIVRYNVNAALDGNLRTMQGDVCDDSGVAGVLAALDFMEKTDPANAPTPTDADSAADSASEPAAQLTEVRTNVDWYLWRMAIDLDGMEWHEHNITTRRAAAALARAGYVPEDETPDLP